MLIIGGGWISDGLLDPSRPNRRSILPAHYWILIVVSPENNRR